MAQLQFFRDEALVFQINLQLGSTKIGRAPHCDIVLSEPEISREHAVIYSIEGKYLIKKLGQGSIEVNNTPIESQAVHSNDKITIGPWTAIFIEKSKDIEELEVTQMDSIPRESLTQAIGHRGGQLVLQEFNLLIRHPEKGLKSYPIRNRSLSIGSDIKNDIWIEDPYISSKHLKITYENNSVWVHDLNSTNGTYLNEIRVREAELEVGNILKIGRCELQLSIEDKLQKISALPVDQFCGIVGSSPQMQQLYHIIQRVSPTEATVLILGESGSGKELVSRAVHQLSTRNAGPFIAINCGAISKELIESELFGHEKGAFTGALNRHEGAFSQAKDGTLFLDEVGELPLDLQPKLLRVLEDKTYRRVGGSEEIKTNVRIIAATHRDLAELVQEKKFREDLFFRLFVLPLYIPPLRHRLNDLAELATNFIKEFTPKNTKKSLSPQALLRLSDYSFPGNVRELRNILLRSMILSQGEVIAEDEILFPESFNKSHPHVEGPRVEKLEEMEERLIRNALISNKWNKAKTSEVLGIAKSTLFSKIKLYQIEEE